MRPEWGVPSLFIAGDPKMAVDVLEAIKRDKRRGQKGTEKVRVLFGHPPRFDAPDAWSRERLMRWARQSAKWLQEHVRRASGGLAVVERVDLHLDEVRPHLHATFVPVMARPRPKGSVPPDAARVGPRNLPVPNQRLSWKAMQAVMFPPEPGARSAKGSSMSGMQDSYWREVGRKFMLKRGVPSDRVREDPDRIKGLTSRVVESQDRAFRAERRVRQQTRAATVEKADVATRNRHLQTGIRRLARKVRDLTAPPDARGGGREHGR